MPYRTITGRRKTSRAIKRVTPPLSSHRDQPAPRAKSLSRRVSRSLTVTMRLRRNFTMRMASSTGLDKAAVEVALTLTHRL